MAEGRLRVLCIDGPIGCGKSTIIRRLGECPHIVELVLGTGKFIVPVLEPIEAWQKGGSFTRMCTKPKQWSHAFQHQALVTRIASWDEVHDEYAANPDAVFVLERAPPSDKLIFTQVLAERGEITPDQQREHGEWYERMLELWPDTIDRVGVMRLSLETAHRRIMQRSRGGEDKYDPVYLRQLHDRYTQLTQSKEWPLYSVTCMLDANRPFHTCDRVLYEVFCDLCGVPSLCADSVLCTCPSCV